MKLMAAAGLLSQFSGFALAPGRHPAVADFRASSAAAIFGIVSLTLLRRATLNAF
jgi:hypothetical protein